MIASAIFIIAALIFINAVYVAAEFSAVGVRRSRIRQLADDGNPLAAVAAARGSSHPRRSIAISPHARSASRSRALFSARTRSARSRSG